MMRSQYDTVTRRPPVFARSRRLCTDPWHRTACAHAHHLYMMLQTSLTQTSTLRLLSQTVNILDLPETQPSFNVKAHDVDE